MSDDVPDLKALRGDRMASDTTYVEQLEQLSLGQEREAVELRATVERQAAELEDAHRFERDARKLEAERDALRSDRDIAGRMLAEILVAVQPQEHYEHVDLDALVPTVRAIVAHRDRLREVVWDGTRLRASLAGARSARDEAREERDRLRAVVDAVRGYVSSDFDPYEVAGFEVIADLRTMLAELDVMDGSPVPDSPDAEEGSDD